ncbi:hypothetical protein PHLCEN_2v11728 [Hermanssonia centrifuga]|uniref:Uncharacterized protein n=1 Tax=Hermanssonia centrifuga TaxID=98765 RepID=A0A2R6NJ22_9APHY|nr:hypothetical protein PHLCEN_2v11728 [Hermanssonia centrifuga]
MDPSQALYSRHRPPFPATLGRQRSLRARAHRKNPSPVPLTLESAEPSIHRDVNPRSLVRWTSFKRERTRTAPEGSFSSPRSNGQRFSLSSPLSKSRLDLLKATILPHPPLPGKRIDMVHEDQPRLSRAKNLNDSTDKIFAELDLFDGEHAHRATSENEGGTVNSIAQDTADNVDLTAYQNHTIKMEETKTNTTCDTKNTEETYSANIPKPKRSRAYSQQGMKTSVYAPLENEAYDSGPGEPKRKSRRSSVSSAISKRALKARSMIIRRPERGISSQDFFAQDRTRQGPHMAALNDNVLPTVQISGEGGRQEDYSIGCAEYEPDLVLNPMDFAAISRRASSSGGVAAPTLVHHPFPSLDAGNWMRV